MFCGLEKERIQNLGKKKKKGQKRKYLIAAKSGLIGIKGYFKTYNQVKRFSPY